MTAQVADYSLSEFGEACYALRLDCVRMEGRMAVSSAALDVLETPREVPYSKMAKLEILQCLRLAGWTVESDPHLLALQREDHSIPLSSLLQSHAYFVAMAESPSIFCKPGHLAEISHHGSQAYYLALLRLDDLNAVAAIENVPTQPNARFVALLDGQSLSARPLAIEDGDCQGSDTEEEPVPARLGLRPHVLRPDETVFLAPMTVSMPGFRVATCHFDQYVHASGRLRVYVGCQKHRGQCRLYRFADDYPTRERACAFMLAWALEGELTFPEQDARVDHIGYTPTPAFVEEVHRRLLNSAGAS